MAEVPYTGVATVSPDASAPDDRQRINASPEAFGASIGRGMEKAGAGLTDASNAAFNLQSYYGKIAVDDQINKLMDTSDKIRRGDPSRTVPGPDGKPQPDVGYLGTMGRTALDQREPTMKALDDAIKTGRDNLTTDQQRLEYDNQSRRMRAMWTDQIGAHSDQQFKTWAGSVNAAAATHALNHIAAFPEGEEFAHGAADLINARVQQVQSQYGDDPELKTEAIAKAKNEALKAQLLSIGARDPSRALQILDKNREIAGGDYPTLVEHFRGRADQQDGYAAADRLIAGRGNRPYGNAAHPLYGQVAGEVPGGMSAAGLARTVQIESSGNPNAGNASDHVGLGQFSQATAAEVGITDRTNPEQSIRGIARYAAANAPMLTKALGHAPDDADFYLAHQQGPAGAAKLLAHPNARAGDLVGDNAIRQNGGDPSAPASAFTDMWRAKFNRAAVATGEVSPAESLAHQEGELKLAVLNDPSMMDRPQMQAAALNRINVTFAAQRELQANDAAAFKLKLANSTAEALDTGAVKNPLAPDQFTAAFGAAEGARQYQEYQANVQLGADRRAVASMSPDEVAAMQQRYQPQAGSDDYAAQQKRSAELTRAIDENRKEMKEDPAAFLVRRTAVGGEAYQRFTQTVADPKKTPEEKQVLASMFAEKILSEQARLGVPEVERRVAPKAYVKSVGDQITAAASSEEAGARAGVIGMVKQQAQLWGDHWGDVMRELAPSMQPVVRAIAAGADESAMQRLLSVDPKEKPTAVLKEQNEVKARDVTTAVNTEMAPFLSTMVGRQKDRDYGSYLSLANELAALYVRDGKDATTAAHDSFNALIGNRYEFRDTYRIPKDPKLNADEIQHGAETMRRDLGKVGAVPPLDDIPGRSDTAPAQDLAKLGRDAVWVTSPKNDGLNLAYGDKWVRSGDGKPLFVPWAALAAAGRADSAAAAEAVPNAGMLP